MLIPGVDFTTIGKVATAYFKCVNDNGGIRGRPIKYILYHEQLNPAQQAALAKQAVESDKVVGIVGNTSFTECGDEREVLQAEGVLRDRRRRAGRVLRDAEHRRDEHRAALLERRRGAAARQAPERSRSSSPRRHDRGVLRRARARSPSGRGSRGKSIPTKLPVTDANTIVLQLVQAAGKGGGMILDFTPDTAPAYMKAAIDQGLIDKVMWGSTTPIANTFMAGQFPQWDKKMFIDPEFQNLTRAVGPGHPADDRDPRQVHEDRPAGVRADGVPGRQVRDAGAPERQGPRSPRSRTTRPSAG